MVPSRNLYLADASVHASLAELAITMESLEKLVKKPETTVLREHVIHCGVFIC